MQLEPVISSYLPQRWPGSIWSIAGGLNGFNPMAFRRGEGTTVIYLFTSACKLRVFVFFFFYCVFGADAKRISNWFVITKAYRASHDVYKH